MNRRGELRAGAAAATAALLLLASPASSESSARSKTPSRSTGLHIAPPIESKRWVNSKRLTSADLAGKVRVVEFWSLGSVHCRNTVIAMRELHGLYAKRGTIFVGVHSPESPRERDSVAVAAAVAKSGIRFPVALDDDRKLFDAFKSRYWPTLYLIDRDGVVRATHVGELQVDTRAWKNFRAAIDSVLVWKTERRS